jgi:hypothetical protein
MADTNRPSQRMEEEEEEEEEMEVEEEISLSQPSKEPRASDLYLDTVSVFQSLSCHHPQVSTDQSGGVRL